jgi:hypothetical protein
MSVKLTTKVWSDKSITRTSDRLVMLALADCHNDTNGCFPSLDVLQEKTQLSREGVSQSLERLTGDKKIRKIKGGGRGKRNNYELYPKEAERVHSLNPLSDAETVNSVDPLADRETVNSVDINSQLYRHKQSTLSIETVNSVDPFSLENGEISERLTVRNRNITVKNARERASVSSSSSSSETAKKKRVTPKQEITPQIPASLDTPEFNTALDKWIQHRQEIRHPLKPTSLQALIDHCAKLGVDRSVAAINHSILNGYRGIFEPSNSPNQKPKFDPNGPPPPL